MRAWVIVCKALFVSAQSLAANKDEDDFEGATWQIGVGLGGVGAVLMSLGIFFLFQIKQKHNKIKALVKSGKKSKATIKGKDLAENVLESEAHIKAFVVSFTFTAEQDGADAQVEVTWMMVSKAVYDDLTVGDDVPVLYSESDIRDCQLEAAAKSATLPALRTFWAGVAVVASLALAVCSIVIPDGTVTWHKYVGLAAWAALQIPVGLIVVVITKTMCLLKQDNAKVLDEVVGMESFTVRHTAGQKIGLGFDKKKDGSCVVSRINDFALNEKRLKQIEPDDILLSVDGKTGTMDELLAVLKSKGTGDPEVVLEFRRKVLPDLLMNTPKRVEEYRKTASMEGVMEI
jgi:hypothetical protein